MSEETQSAAIDVRLGRIEQDCHHTRDKVERLHSEVASQGQLLRSLEDNSRATATATIELAALARAKDQREHQEADRKAKIEEQAAESRQAALDRFLASLGENWKYLVLLAVLILQPGAAEMLRAWGLIPSVPTAPTYIINESAPPPAAMPEEENADH